MKNQTQAAKRGAKRIALTVIARYEAEDRESSVTDILTDLRHFCDAHGIDFADRDRVARTHYVAESPAST